jgi:methyl-accepting chemotaxis protein
MRFFDVPAARKGVTHVVGRVKGLVAARAMAGSGIGLSARLVASFLTIVLLSALIAWIGLEAIAVPKRSTASIVDENIPELQEAASAIAAANRTGHLTLEYAVATHDIERAGMSTEIDSLDGRIEDYVASAFQDEDLTEREKDALTEVQSAWESFVAARDRGVFVPANAGNSKTARKAALTSVKNNFDAVLASLDKVSELQEEEARAARAAARRRYSSGIGLTIAAGVAAVLLGIAIAFVIARRMSRAMGKVASAAAGIASGDLTVRAEVTTRDEIETMAEAFNAMADRLHHMVTSERAVKTALEGAVSDYSRFAERVASGDLTARVATNGSAELKTLTSNLNAMVSGLGNLSGEVLKSAQGVGASASQILATVSAQSATVTQQSAAINETSVTVDELRASAEQAALKAQAVASQAQTSVQVSAEGTEAVDIIIARLESIRERVETIAQNILQLSEQTHQISELTATVDDISEQSNLLALNATIEAARAGEQGRGFAVVAAEVRNLAEQSKQGTAQVRTILTDIQKATNSAVMATEQGIKVVEESRALGHRAGESIATLAATIKETAQAAQQISATAQQQSLGIDQISESMKDIAEAATQFVSGVAESKSSARGLDDLATELQGLTERYKVRAG